jgi:hypothetical protein
MIWLYAAFMPFVISCLFLGQHFLSSCQKKEGFAWKSETVCLAKETLFPLVLNILLALLISLAYRLADSGKMVLPFLAIDFSLELLHPLRQSEKASKKEPISPWLLAEDLAFLLFLALELFVFNFSALANNGGASDFVFSSLRFAFLFFFVYFACHLPSLLAKKQEAESGGWAQAKKRLGIVALFLFLFFIVLTLCDASRFYIAYPVDSLYTSDNPFLYYNLFSAFLHGHLYLDEVPSSALAALSNPYDPSSRYGISYLWDTAYYQGKYYCYYGPAPVVLVMFPVYFLSGCRYLPTGLFLEVFALGAYGIGFFYLALSLGEKFIHSFEPCRFNFLTAVAFLSSLSLNFITYRWTDWKYQLPFDFGLMFLVFFLALCFQASLAKEKRWWLLTLAGFAYVGIMASRPDLGIGVFIALPSLWGMASEKENTAKAKVLDFLGMVVVLGSGGGLLIAYNVLRYGSALEFGQSYQLTLMDPSANHLSASGFLSAFVHYLAEPYSFSSKAPYLGLSGSPLSFDSHPYNAGSVGTLFYPFFYAVFLLPFLWRKLAGWEEKLSLCALMISPLVLAYTIYCLGGVCYRYQLGIWPFFAIASLWLLLKWDSLMTEKTAKVAYPLVYGFSALSVWLILNLAINTFDGLTLGPVGYLGHWISEAF